MSVARAGAMSVDAILATSGAALTSCAALPSSRSASSHKFVAHVASDSRSGRWQMRMWISSRVIWGPTLAMALLNAVLGHRYLLT
jgi:hypothetical protein